MVRVDGESAGFAAYRTEPGRVVFTHTVVDPAVSGRGVGSTLVRAALDDARSQGKQIVALCPFIGAFIHEHTEYADLVAD